MPLGLFVFHQAGSKFVGFMPFFKEAPSSGAIQLQCSFGGIITYSNLALRISLPLSTSLKNRAKATRQTTLTNLINQMDSPEISGTDVIEWACPLPSFGDLSTSRVATLGLNPSNQEFEEKSGVELQGTSRRFPTLNSLGLQRWPEIDTQRLCLILESCRRYFLDNPYNKWFRPLNQVVLGTNTSFYDASRSACHLDLVPYATSHKWTELTNGQRSSLLNIAPKTLGLLLRDSPVRILILNGQSVVNQFERTAGISLERLDMPQWSLPRHSKPAVRGFAFTGVVHAMAGVTLDRPISVLGFNHNLQNSFGVTTKVVNSIRDWIADNTSLNGH